jgi:mRNA interferase MazF
MTSYSFGDIILVPFPFTDQTSTKKRPAVVISSDVYNQEHPDLIVMAITSQRYISTMLGDVTVTYWNEAGLLKPSVIKAIMATGRKDWW